MPITPKDFSQQDSPPPFTYNVDISFCLDISASSEQLIAIFSQWIITFDESFKFLMASKGKTVHQLRIRLITFNCPNEFQSSLVSSDFLSTSTQQKYVSNILRNIKCSGTVNCNVTLDALTEAMHSEWTAQGERQRHQIVVITSANDHVSNTTYNLDEMTDLWEGVTKSQLHSASRRLIMFAPDSYPWSEIEDSWPQTVFLPMELDAKIKEIPNLLLELLSNSI